MHQVKPNYSSAFFILFLKLHTLNDSLILLSSEFQREGPAIRKVCFRRLVLCIVMW